MAHQKLQSPDGKRVKRSVNEYLRFAEDGTGSREGVRPPELTTDKTELGVNMEDCGFQSQLLSVMEVLAKAAVAEITRRVDDSCAVLRLEVSRSRRDIELLKRKSEAMEAELRRSRMRARRKAAERFSPLVRVVLNRGRQSTYVERADEAGPILIKEEGAEDDLWTN
ncbi:hypothetical protein FQN60_016644, partial [Etheostoma spectabile]